MGVWGRGENDTMNTAIKIAIAVALLGAAVVFGLRSMGRSVETDGDDPTDTRWMCTAEGCGKDFALSFAQLGEFYQKSPGASPPCPACGKSSTVRATACPSCGKTVAKHDRQDRSGGAKPPTCPHCGKPLGG